MFIIAETSHKHRRNIAQSPEKTITMIIKKGAADLATPLV